MTGTNYTTHVYLSTACLHAREPGREHLHEHCQAKANLEGEEKIPGTCKWCPAPCTCTCHSTDLASEQQRMYERLEALVDQALAQYEQGYTVNVEPEMARIARELTRKSS